MAKAKLRYSPFRVSPWEAWPEPEAFASLTHDKRRKLQLLNPHLRKDEPVLVTIEEVLKPRRNELQSFGNVEWCPWGLVDDRVINLRPHLVCCSLIRGCLRHCCLHIVVDA